MLDQLRALIALRILLLRRSISKRVVLSGLVFGIVLCGVTLAGLGGGIGLFIAARALPASAPFLLMCDILVFVCLFFWGIDLVSELQRSDLIDMRKLLYLPLSLPMVFLMNFSVSLFSIMLPLFVLPVIGLTLGATSRFGAPGLLILPAALLFYAMLAAWAHYIRGVLGALMENKRRQRTVIAILTVSFVLVFQLPNILTNVVGRQVAERYDLELSRDAREAMTSEQISAWEEVAKQRKEALLAQGEEWLYVGNAVLPIAWFPLAAYGAVNGQALTYALPVAGMLGLTSAGLALSYRATWRYYMGIRGRRRRSRKESARAEPTRGAIPRSLLDRELPFLRDDTTALAYASFLSYWRQPNIRMMLIMPIVVGAILLGMFAGQLWGAEQPSRFGPQAWLPLAVVVWPFLNFSVVLFNLFGFDGDGFRALVLLPTDRSQYLLAKNVAIFPFVGAVALVLVALGSIIVRPPISVTAPSVITVFQLYLLYATVGNFTSTYFPYRVRWQGMRASGSAGAGQWVVGLVSLGLTLVAVTPAAICMLLDTLILPFLGYQAIPAGTIMAALLLLLTIGLYAKTLGMAGDLLQARERRVLEVITRPQE